MSNVAEKQMELSTNHRNQYRSALRNSREEILASESVTIMPFQEWIDQTYGVEMLKNDDGYYTMNYNVSDEKRFMLFQLKFCGAQT